MQKLKIKNVDEMTIDELIGQVIMVGLPINIQMNNILNSLKNIKSAIIYYLQEIMIIPNK